jgi:hypothetical protein
MLPEDSRFRLADDRAVARVIDGDAIVIDTITGRYYSLEGPSQTAWSLLLASLSLGEVAAALRERFETGDADVLADVGRVAEELVAEKLLVPVERGSGVAPSPPPSSNEGPRAAYTAPAVTVFRDMEDLLAFDPPLPVSDVTVWTADPGPSS